MKRSFAVVSAMALATGLGASPASATALAPSSASSSSAGLSDAVTSARALLADHPTLVRASSRDRFTVTDAVGGSRGMTHVRFDRTYRGLSVLGGDVVVHQRAGAKASVSSALGAPIALSTTPRISARAAAAIARRAGLTGKARTTSVATPRLVVDAQRGRGALAWVATSRGVQADGQTPSVRRTVVDARSGRVRSTEETILGLRALSAPVAQRAPRLRPRGAAATGTGRSLFLGQVPLSTTTATGGFSLVDSTHGGNSACDAANRTGSCTIFKDADNAWGSGTTSDRATAAVDAYYGAALTWDYYRASFGRSGIFDDGRGVPSRVHYDSNYVNAFWDGRQMTYGDGANDAAPLVALDVAGHEMSHGVTEATAGLVYSGDAGGLNEATSDIFGSMVEFSAASSADPGDYLIGEKIDIFGTGAPLRYMDEPSKDGRGSFDCWSSAVPGSDPHYSSGVGNHFFFLLAEGSGAGTFGNSPTCDGSTVTGIGRDKAAAIWYRALTAYMTSTETYAKARVDTIAAADELYGAGSTESAAVAAAWTAVAIG
jgi:zinc metalloprotease ZmpA